MHWVPQPCLASSEAHGHMPGGEHCDYTYQQLQRKKQPSAATVEPAGVCSAAAVPAAVVSEAAVGAEGMQEQAAVEAARVQRLAEVQPLLWSEQTCSAALECSVFVSCALQSASLCRQAWLLCPLAS